MSVRTKRIRNKLSLSYDTLVYWVSINIFLTSIYPRPNLSASNLTARFTFAIQYSHFTSSQWNIFSHKASDSVVIKGRNFKTACGFLVARRTIVITGFATRLFTLLFSLKPSSSCSQIHSSSTHLEFVYGAQYTYVHFIKPHTPTHNIIR